MFWEDSPQICKELLYHFKLKTDKNYESQKKKCTSCLGFDYVKNSIPSMYIIHFYPNRYVKSLL